MREIREVILWRSPVDSVVSLLFREAQKSQKISTKLQKNFEQNLQTKATVRFLAVQTASEHWPGEQ